jgi:hypothetical protein
MGSPGNDNVVVDYQAHWYPRSCAEALIGRSGFPAAARLSAMGDAGIAVQPVSPMPAHHFNIAGNPAGTALALSRLIRPGLLDRHPGLEDHRRGIRLPKRGTRVRSG